MATPKGNELARTWAASSGNSGVPATNMEEVDKRIGQLLKDHENTLRVLLMLVRLLRTVGVGDDSRRMLNSFMAETKVGQKLTGISDELHHRLTGSWMTGANFGNNLKEIEEALNSLLTEPDATPAA